MNNEHDKIKMSKLFSVKNKVVVITGGSGFLGSKYVDFFSQHEAIVINIDKTGDYATDITSEEAVKTTVGKILQQHETIDVLINNASFNIHIDPHSITNTDTDYLAPFEEYPLDGFIKGISVDLIGTNLLCKYVLPTMNDHKQGSIINIGSVYGIVAPDQRLYDGIPNPKNPGQNIVKPAYYSVAKAGLLGFTQYLASYAAPYVRVNQLTLGGIEHNESDEFKKRYSEKTMLNRMGSPNDIFGPLLFLASSASQYITGQNIIVDGGFTAW